MKLRMLLLAASLAGGGVGSAAAAPPTKPPAPTVSQSGAMTGTPPTENSPLPPPSDKTTAPRPVDENGTPRPSPATPDRAPADTNETTTPLGSPPTEGRRDLDQPPSPSETKSGKTGSGAARGRHPRRPASVDSTVVDDEGRGPPARRAVGPRRSARGHAAGLVAAAHTDRLAAATAPLSREIAAATDAARIAGAATTERPENGRERLGNRGERRGCRV
jgi:hypothetical protein